MIAKGIVGVGILMMLIGLVAGTARCDTFDVTLIATSASSLGEPSTDLENMELTFSTDGVCAICTVSGATASGGEPSSVVANGITSFLFSPPLYNLFSGPLDGQTWGHAEFDRTLGTLNAELGDWGSDLTWIYPDGTWHNDGDGSRDTFGVYVIHAANPEPSTCLLLGSGLVVLWRCRRL